MWILMGEVQSAGRAWGAARASGCRVRMRARGWLLASRQRLCSAALPCQLRQQPSPPHLTAANVKKFLSASAALRSGDRPPKESEGTWGIGRTNSYGAMEGASIVFGCVLFFVCVFELVGTRRARGRAGWGAVVQVGRRAQRAPRSAVDAQHCVVKLRLVVSWLNSPAVQPASLLNPWPHSHASLPVAAVLADDPSAAGGICGTATCRAAAPTGAPCWGLGGER